MLLLLVGRVALSEWAEVEETGKSHLGRQEYDPVLQDQVLILLVGRVLLLVWSQLLGQ